ncbi:hypothetical protein [Photobacterium angustum]|uniref:Uncharacterized protein n=1 Tax=Photobacterium angustum TaxID=661 RepID=A0A855SHJ0_PHOAN|nr:hypothetical protein [Photobacterium angustum]PSX08555.1 hypothetical protein C0W41_05550 [Photobacterium angustum]PSX13949.1 hypothetical protein C0W55_13125 [Photobacterium angustum]PSX23000.1 hypothetical protein C0W36_13345 [Photobacterium angustum]PSX40313.1 hypothetical protein C0W34_14000 [Photobacterium angustum]
MEIQQKNSESIITVPVSDLYATLRGDLNFKLFEVEAFAKLLDEQPQTECFALNSERALATKFIVESEYLSKHKTFLGWFGFWMCVFNQSEPSSHLEHQALGAIRGLFFAAAAYDLLLPQYLTTWWHETALIHNCNKLEMCA